MEPARQPPLIPPTIRCHSRLLTCLRELEVLGLEQREPGDDANFHPSGIRTARKPTRRGSEILPKATLTKLILTRSHHMIFSWLDFPANRSALLEYPKRTALAVSTASKTRHRELCFSKLQRSLKSRDLLAYCWRMLKTSFHTTKVGHGKSFIPPWRNLDTAFFTK